MSILIAIIVLLIVIGAVRGERTVRAMKAAGFTPGKKVRRGTKAIILSKDSRQLCFVGGGKSFRVLRVEDVLEVEVIEDGETITRTSRGSQAAGAVVGSVLLGPVGLLIGAVTGSKVSRQRVTALELKLHLADTAQPVFRLNFLPRPVLKNSLVYRKSAEELDEWHGTLTAAIAIAKREPSSQPPIASPVEPPPPLPSLAEPDRGVPAPSNGFVADELHKMASLVERGLLTTEEYAAQKRRILNG